MAMEGVAQCKSRQTGSIYQIAHHTNLGDKALDPGNALFSDWLKTHQMPDRNLIIDVGGGNGHLSTSLATQFPSLSFEVQDISQTLLTQGQQSLPPALQPRIKFNQRDMFKPQPTAATSHVVAFMLRNVLWNWSDEDCIRLLQTFIPVMEINPDTVILVNDGMSPARGTFEPHIEKAYRRRDVTVMTMHNTKQRTEEEWRDVFKKASPHFMVSEIMIILFLLEILLMMCIGGG
jgi:ubiquinone/menaquinone biosynthesis C-methylase UbiE